jgi:hypothetical protein
MSLRLAALAVLLVAAGCDPPSGPLPPRLHVEIAPGWQSPTGLDWTSILIVRGETPQAPVDLEMRLFDGRADTYLAWPQAGSVSAIAIAGRSDGTAVARAVAGNMLPASGGDLSLTLGADLLSTGEAPAALPPIGDAPNLVVDKAFARPSGGGHDLVGITNSGRRATDELVVSTVGSSQFATSGCVGDRLQPGQHCDLTVTFAPGNDGAPKLAVAFVDDRAGHMTAIALAGR